MMTVMAAEADGGDTVAVPVRTTTNPRRSALVTTVPHLLLCPERRRARKKFLGEETPASLRRPPSRSAEPCPVLRDTDRTGGSTAQSTDSGSGQPGNSGGVRRR